MLNSIIERTRVPYEREGTMIVVKSWLNKIYEQRVK